MFNTFVTVFCCSLRDVLTNVANFALAFLVLDLLLLLLFIPHTAVKLSALTVAAMLAVRVWCFFVRIFDDPQQEDVSVVAACVLLASLVACKQLARVFGVLYGIVCGLLRGLQRDNPQAGLDMLPPLLPPLSPFLIPGCSDAFVPPLHYIPSTATSTLFTTHPALSLPPPALPSFPKRTPDPPSYSYRATISLPLTPPPSPTPTPPPSPTPTPATPPLPLHRSFHAPRHPRYYDLRHPSPYPHRHPSPPPTLMDIDIVSPLSTLPTYEMMDVDLVSPLFVLRSFPEPMDVDEDTPLFPTPMDLDD